MSADLRTPIVCVLGHVDHGKTTLLDRIRGSAVVEREAGLITQHIGATEVPLSTIERMCGKKGLILPGLLFIDTPGHRAFTTLRSRGSALADIAVLVIDVNDGFQPQTLEALNILRRYRTPFVVAANKIDRIPGWNPTEDADFTATYPRQVERVKKELDDRVYEIVGRLYEEGFSADRYDRITDFQRTIGVVPVSARTGEGVPDLLLVLLGLSQRFLRGNLGYQASGPGVGTILEVKEETGLGTTIDVILYNGEFRVGDTLVVGSLGEPVVTKIRALLKPRALQEIRIEDRFERVKRVTAAAGVKISAPNLEEALAGAPVRSVRDKGEIEKIKKEVRGEIEEVRIDTDRSGVIIKADTLGSLEALASELNRQGIPVRKADIGDISKRDVMEASADKKVIMGFGVGILPDALEEIKKARVRIFQHDVIYKLVEEYQEWEAEERAMAEKKRSEAIVRPGIFRLIPGLVFRQSKPAIVGVEVLAGVIKTNLDVIQEKGVSVGVIKGIQDKGEPLPEAKKGMEVAVALDGPIIGRQVKEGDTLYIDIPERHAKILEQEIYESLTEDEKEALSRFLEIKRKDNPFWGK